MLFSLRAAALSLAGCVALVAPAVASEGWIADFDEALETLVDMYPHRDSILKSSGQSGSGATGGSGGAVGRWTKAPFRLCLNAATLHQRWLVMMNRERKRGEPLKHRTLPPALPCRIFPYQPTF